MTEVEDAPEEAVPHGEAPASNRRTRSIVEWGIVVVVAVAISLLLRAFAFQTFFVPSGSMEPTLWPGDRIVVDKLAVEFGTINIGDIVVFHAPAAVKTDCGDAVSDLVKRVIGVPGDHIYSKGNTIYVNGKALDQKWSVFPTMGPTPVPNMVVPAGQYFMMGDNHADSCDSRTWGTVPRSLIIGKVFVRIWPLTKVNWY